MPNCINYNCDPLGEHTIEASCAGLIKGGASNLIILDCDHTVTNPSSAQQLNDNITAGTAKIVTNVKFGWSKPSPVTVDSTTSCGVAETVTYDWTATLQDGSVSDTNIDFWNVLAAGRKIGGIIALECYDSGETPYVTWIDALIQTQGGRVLPNVNTQAQTIDLDLKWRSKRSPQKYDAPVGVTDGSQTFN